MFWHAAMALDSWDYLWATVAVWLFSLFGRLFAKIKSPGLKGAEATLEDIDGEVLKISIPAFEIMSWKPGQHVFLRFPTLAPLDNHPFTVASSCDETYVTDKHGRNSRTPMMFLIRPHDGMTKSLMRLAGQDSERATRQVVVDGPYGGYGGKLELRFDQIILVAGGTGITAVLPLLTDLSRKIGRERTVLKEIKLIWAVKNKRALSWVRRELQYALATAPAGAVTISYYITSENSTSETSSLNGFVSSGNGDLEKGSPHVPVGQKFLQIHEKNHNFGPGVFGRPILSQIIPVSLKLQRTCLIGKSLPRFQPRVKKLIEQGCGPKGMNQDLSNAAAASQKRVISGELQEVALHTETFGW
jgi:NAD(P)H-flavin reductase